MDKRTLLFVVSITATLFLVNTYFEYQSAETVKIQREQMVERSKVREKELVEEIARNQVANQQLPLATVYQDSEGTRQLTEGVIVGDSLLLLSWSDSVPETLYAGQSSSTLNAYKLQASASGEGYPALYSKGEGAPLNIADLPDFGSFNLQMITAFPEQEKAALVAPALFSDGSFNSLTDELANVKKSLGEKSKAPLENALVLMKHDGEWLPVAIYRRPGGQLLYLQDIGSLPTRVSRATQLQPGDRPQETFYVLENAYQQLVISNYGAALSELNLPLHSKENEKSVVKEIEIGREMVEKHPYNARFPLRGYYTPGDSVKGPFVDNNQGSLGGYYPLLRRDMIQQGQRKSVRVPPEFYGLNVVSKYPEMAELVYNVSYFDSEKIIFESSQPHRRITKTYSLAKDAAPYCFEVAIDIQGDSRGLWITSGVPEVELISGAPAPSLMYRVTKNENGEVRKVDLPSSNKVTADTSIYPDWLSNGNGFFGVILDPLTAVDSGYRAQYVSGAEVPSRILEIGQEYERYQASNLPGYAMQYPLKNGGGSVKFRVFAGPYSTPILKAVDAIYTDPKTGANPDYIGCQTFHGWFAFISEPFAKVLFFLLNAFHWLTGSWAFSIVLLTVALRVMLYPLNNWSTKSMAKMQALSPKIQAIQQKHKGDQKKAQLEIMNLYRESGVNPIGGCFPMLIQLPFLIGMFDLLKSSFQLRGASFIPGWIDNLTAPDVLFEWETPLPLIGNAFHLLPIILGVIMFFQMRMSSPMPKDKSMWTEQQRQQRTMSTIMPVFFTWMFYTFPSGLNIYWISSTLLGILQQWWTSKRMKAATAAVIIEKAESSKPAGKVKIKGRRP